MSYIDKLIENCNQAKVAKASKEFTLGELSELDGIKKAIYVIEELGGNNFTTFESFIDFKKLGERKCAKLNSPSPILYVGSSTTGVRKRIEQHLGDGYQGTYALHLKYWFKGKYKITIKQYEVTKEVLQIIEDDISDRLKPAFGKKGGNNG